MKLRRRGSKPCPFCNVTDGPNFKVVTEDEKYTMFVDRTPAASEHYLVIPKAHLESIRDLRKNDVHIVKDLWEMGERYFDTKNVPKEQRRFGFHIPPFTSVDHLHLHCFVLPFKDMIREHKYRATRRNNSVYVKGWGWFIEVEQTIHVLERGGRVGFAPC